jgi:hypothetical protein
MHMWDICCVGVILDYSVIFSKNSLTAVIIFL